MTSAFPKMRFRDFRRFASRKLRADQRQAGPGPETGSGSMMPPSSPRRGARIARRRAAG